MASVVTANPTEGADPSVPRRADGSLYRYEMIFGGFTARVYADSVTELCEHLITGYAELEEDVAQAAARIEHAVRAQVQLRLLSDQTLRLDEHPEALACLLDEPPQPVGADHALLWCGKFDVVCILPHARCEKHTGLFKLGCGSSEGTSGSLRDSAFGIALLVISASFP